MQENVDQNNPEYSHFSRSDINPFLPNFIFWSSENLSLFDILN